MRVMTPLPFRKPAQNATHYGVADRAGDLGTQLAAKARGGVFDEAVGGGFAFPGCGAFGARLGFFLGSLFKSPRIHFDPSGTSPKMQ